MQKGVNEVENELSNFRRDLVTQPGNHSKTTKLRTEGSEMKSNKLSKLQCGMQSE